MGTYAPEPTGSSALPAELERAADSLDVADIEAILTVGSLELEGRLVSASNASFLAQVSLGGASLSCIYKPVQGERPLWDFPDGTLAGRERAARLVSEAGGFDVVPPTVLRDDGRFGPGMCQLWVDVGSSQEHNLIDVVAMSFGEEGWLTVLEAEDHRSRPVLLVHRDDDQLRDMAVLDAVINNADRKGGHILPDEAGHVWGCDHGVCFHVEDKLRTVLWGWADEPLRAGDTERLARLSRKLDGNLAAELSALLTRREVAALRRRVAQLLTSEVMPLPSGDWPAIPWPAF
ncbi:MAG: SCO1664 family protein [Nocardioidaceae bacterium]